MHLRCVQYNHSADLPNSFPFTLPWLPQFASIEFATPVTFLVGDNGVGKSTLLETVAVLANSITVGALPVATDPSLEPARLLSEHMRAVWNRRTKRGFFLRAEDFINFSRNTATLRDEMKADLQRVRIESQHRSPLAQSLAELPYRGSISALESAYGAGLEAKSHGEGFFTLFESRLVPDGLYLLDEPETPLSPIRQLALMALMKDMVAQDCQFIIASHSPMLMAYPGATIYEIGPSEIRTARYEELEHVSIMKAFLNNPEAFLHRL